jgi:hypothetical protein
MPKKKKEKKQNKKVLKTKKVKKILDKRFKIMTLDQIGKTINKVQIDKKEVFIQMEKDEEIPILKNILRDAEIDYQVVGGEENKCFKLIPRILTQEEELEELDKELDDFLN